MSKQSALVIEDDADAATIFAEALRASGFEVDIVGAGDRALEQLDAITPDVVVLDLQLPRVSGLDILDHIRADPRLVDTRVIVATAHAHIADGTRRQADLVLLKPISFSQLRDLSAFYARPAEPDEE